MFAPPQPSTVSLQSTHPHGVRLYSAYEADCNFEFQSTHPHGVRPWNFRTDIRLSIVSIHAPTRGATLPFQHMDTSACHVSIHAPTRGATMMWGFFKKILIGFNPRTHTGCDNAFFDAKPRRKVSIHAPTRGATFYYIQPLVYR